VRFFLFIVIVFISNFSRAENLDSFLMLIKGGEYQKASQIAKEDLLLKKYAEILYYSGDIDSIFFNEKYPSKLNKE
jgi:hypothetical protein